MNIKKVIILSLVSIFIIIMAGNHYFSDQLPKSMVNRIIQKSIEGNFSDLNIRSQDKETLQRFFNNEYATKDLDFSGEFTHMNPNRPELLYNFEYIDYNQINQIRQIIGGALAIEMTRQSFFKWKIKQVRIIKKLQISM
ncbi:hypothetical protein [Paenibacillus sabinae]|uniref:Uncharacterized protein n=1 Tax=Paenibacillus sabinae T27 TaxID=1268072 RepID=X4ZVG0_9BACL|nr:hypothetical protein [Paenibacillus sabinae]AHV95739.1 hypothetical protein PSAB_04015 [Paenibacillus sabinae T27]